MRLAALDPEFLRHEGRALMGAPFEQAQSIWFECPVCRDARSHHVLVSFADRGLADDQGSQDRAGKPSRWKVSGTGIDDLTLEPSIDCTPSCTWHGWLKNGECTSC
jgi:hypothetical protein